MTAKLISLVIVFELESVRSPIYTLIVAGGAYANQSLCALFFRHYRQSSCYVHYSAALPVLAGKPCKERFVPISSTCNFTPSLTRSKRSIDAKREIWNRLKILLKSIEHCLFVKRLSILLVKIIYWGESNFPVKSEERTLFSQIR